MFSFLKNAFAVRDIRRRILFTLFIFAVFRLGSHIPVGTRNISKGSDYPHHHAFFNVVEESLKVSAELYGQYALSYIYIKMNFN